MASKLAFGPGSLHILSSNGPSSDNLHFYSTTYSTKYNAHDGIDKDKDQLKKPPLNIRHKGTGYSSNFRPTVYYSSVQDEVDNPPMRKLLRDNYHTSTHRDFVKYEQPDPNGPLPSHVISGPSGFAENMHPTLPTRREVRDAHMDTKLGGSLPIYPRHRPLLHSIKDHDQVERENADYGPKAMSTECHTRFTGKIPPTKACSLHGRVEDSGYTEAYNVEPLTFRPFETHGGELPGYMTWRPTGTSIMRNDFHGATYMTGNEPLQSLSSRANLSTGFVKGNNPDSQVQPRAGDKFGFRLASQVHPTERQRLQRSDPAEHSNMTHPYQYTTLAGHTFRGRQRLSLSSGEGGVLARERVGCKEGSGYSANTLPFVERASRTDHPARFSTNYKYRFLDPTLKGVARFGHVAGGGGVLPLSGSNGFILNTRLHTLATGERDLKSMDPYTARSLSRHYPHYSDTTHNHKARSVTTGTV